MRSWETWWMCGMVAMSLSGLKAPAEQPIRVACVGDSITFGMGIENRAAHSYPAMLQDLLGPAYEVRNFGVSATTALKNGAWPYWETPEFKAALAFSPDIVVLMLGTNDSHMGNRGERDQFEDDLRDLARTLRGPGGRAALILGLPPPETGFWRSLHERVLRQDIRPAIRRVAESEGAVLADLEAVFSGREDWLPDGIHPNEPGAEAIARTMREAIRTSERRQESNTN